MCDGRVRFAAIEARFDLDFPRYFRAELMELDTLEADGLIRRDAQEIALTASGRLLMRNVAMVFDAYLQPRTHEPTYSRVIWLHLHDSTSARSLT